MKNNLSSLLILFLTGMIFSGCKKDKESEQDKAIKLITAKPWHNVFRGYDYNNNGVLDMTITENSIADIPCVLDDNYTFKKEGAYTNDGYGNTNGDGCGVGSYTSSWELKAKVKEFDFDKNQGKMEILNDSTMQFYVMLNNEKSYYIFKR